MLRRAGDAPERGAWDCEQSGKRDLGAFGADLAGELESAQGGGGLDVVVLWYPDRVSGNGGLDALAGVGSQDPLDAG